MVSLGLCPPWRNLLQPWTCQDTRAEATEPDLLPARCQAAALGEEAGSLWGRGQQDQAVLIGKALVNAKVSVLHPLSLPASAGALPILGGSWFCTFCLLSIML